MKIFYLFLLTKCPFSTRMSIYQQAAGSKHIYFAYSILIFTIHPNMKLCFNSQFSGFKGG